MRFLHCVPAARAVGVASICVGLAACGGSDEAQVIAPTVTEPAVEVRVTSHADGETVRRAEVRLEGIVTPGAEVRVNGRRARRTGGGRDEPDRFAMRLALRRGSNTIRVTATKPGSEPAERMLVLVRRRAASRQRDDEGGRSQPAPAPGPDPGPGDQAGPPERGGAPAPSPRPRTPAPRPQPDQGGPGAPAPPESDQGGPPAPAPLPPSGEPESGTP